MLVALVCAWEGEGGRGRGSQATRTIGVQGCMHVGLPSVTGCTFKHPGTTVWCCRKKAMIRNILGLVPCCVCLHVFVRPCVCVMWRCLGVDIVCVALLTRCISAFAAQLILSELELVLSSQASWLSVLQ